MKIQSITNLAIPEVKIIEFARFPDERGYFTESFRASDLKKHEQLPEFKALDFLQANESYSKKNVVRGLHFQWSPFMGKLVRPVFGHLVDIVLDIRLGSPTFGKVIMADLPVDPKNLSAKWIWVPPGFAHGTFFPQDSLIEYFCTGEYSPGNEAGISPLAEDLDWSLCDSNLKAAFDEAKDQMVISEKDKLGVSLGEWQQDERSKNFIYG